MPRASEVQVDPQEAVALLAECVRAESVNPPGNEERVTSLLSRRFEREGLPVELHRLSPGRANLVARLRGSGGGPTLVLSGHTDTVPPGEAPWQHGPWSADLAGDRLYGRGACDMKSGLAAMVLAVLLLRRRGVPLRGDLVLAASAGEEVDCLGARSFIDTGGLSGVDAIVVGEPTGGEVAIAHKGALWLRLTTRGQTAHGAMPERGVNALLLMHRVIDRLERFRLPADAHPLLGQATMSINTIQGGHSVNVVPDRCRAEVDMRTVPGLDHAGLERDVRGALGDLGFPVEVEVLTSRPPVQTDPEAPVVRLAREVVTRDGTAPRAPVGLAYFTDASVYQPALKVPVVVYGPGEASVCHQPDEWVALPAYLEAIRFYAALAQAYLS
ncbi:MAG TPA: M20 family metallopeptidase [bacterium]|nr:M20 family metallopeptidase [bacterium]